MRTLGRQFVAFATVAVLIVGCKGGDATIKVEKTTPGTKAPMSAPAKPAPTTAPADTGMINSFKDIQPAVIYITTAGTFRYPGEGFATEEFTGSGFIIDPEGYAVTNNHVVAGAAKIEVYIGGDTDRAYNASVVGVSECNDLALIKIATNETLPYLDWNLNPPTVGTEVFAAGFPHGDPEFTLTRGIIAKAKADGETAWASIDYILEHDANLQPGNSGGPLVDENGHVTGINYAGSSLTNQDQFFAITASHAATIVEKLKNGNYESLGINGDAVADGFNSGIWVYGVAPGSPASEAGILPGDVITSLNNLPMAPNGTMTEYCDVIRTAGEGKTMNIEVYRDDTSETLTGELNGNKPLTANITIGDPPTDPGDGPDQPVPSDDDYVTITDDSGTIAVDVPASLTEIDTSASGAGLPEIFAAHDLAEFNSRFDVPGILMRLTDYIDYNDMDAQLSAYGPNDGFCSEDAIFDEYDDGVYSGRWMLIGGCGDSNATVAIILANDYSSSPDFSINVFVQMVDDVDADDLQRVIDSFFVLNS
ncbi:MAG: peptidase S1 [Ilumatobacter coccineus]|uniref:Peptidase S1 n=1 Tax=Ilumatobacter coccineus TaxID=467094 RepID=A0A2G6KG65_9ACTN|nr:MAG: peptidase S1 [Ilumatobacter coccineus]